MNIPWSQHLIILPILLPLLCGAVLLPINETRHRLKYAINMASVLGLLLTALLLVLFTDNELWQKGIGVYFAANWASPFGIALVADRLAAVMLLVAAMIALAVLIYSARRWSRIGVHFHSLFQFLLMGINGAFLTHDLFNLFVFFEVMLAASYGLLLHGYNVTRIRAGIQYIAINLAASLLFLIGVALIYASSGTLNMADLALRLNLLSGEELMLLKTGISILAIAFLVKSAMWPLGFWLPATYGAASPPVAAMLVLMTKVGAYVILRIWTLVFSDGAGAVAGFGLTAMLWGGMATIVFGTLGMLASDSAEQIAGYGAIVSSGILLSVIGYGQPSLVAAGLYYLVGSTLGLSAFMLLLELIERIRSPGAAMLALTMEAFAVEESPEEPVGVGIPGTLAFLGLSFAACMLIIAGLPPLSGFIAKFGLFHALLNPGNQENMVTLMTWALMALIVISGLAAIISLMRFGVRTFWAVGKAIPPTLSASEAIPINLLLLASLLLTIKAGPVVQLLQRANDDLHQPALYMDRVLSPSVVPGVSKVPAKEAK
jgi:multicomponent K+:H+ antiporter subunit D